MVKIHEAMALGDKVERTAVTVAGIEGEGEGVKDDDFSVSCELEAEPSWK